ncbi:MAG: type VI secretion system ATPase TssH, partial [Gammaproteobacteria bacterium]|nr:type VI secretion system ATPase TssH [Gammaproteobacteria bacterium]
VVGSHFRPEFINRVDESVVFHPLQKEQIQGIATIQLRELQARLAERDLTLELSDAAMEYLVSAGFDPVYGARPLKRAMQQAVENPLALQLLSGDFPTGAHIRADVSGDQLVFGQE